MKFFLQNIISADWKLLLFNPSPYLLCQALIISHLDLYQSDLLKTNLMV